MVARYIQGSLCRIETGDDVEAGLVYGTLWLFSVLEGNPNLIRNFGALVLYELLERLCKVILDQIEKDIVVLFRNARVMHEEGTVRYERVGGLSGNVASEGLEATCDVHTFLHSCWTRSELSCSARKRSRSMTGSVSDRLDMMVNGLLSAPAVAFLPSPYHTHTSQPRC